MSDRVYDVQPPPLHRSDQLQNAVADAYGRPPLSSAAAEKQINQTIKAVSEDMKDPHTHMRGLQTIAKELISLERYSNCLDVENKLLGKLIADSDQTHLTFVQNGSELKFQDAHGLYGTVDRLAWTAKHQSGHRSLGAQDFMQEQAATADNSSIQDVSYPNPMTAQPGDGARKPLQGGVREQSQRPTFSGNVDYPAPVMVEPPRQATITQEQRPEYYHGVLAVPDDVITVDANSIQNLPTRQNPGWMEVTSSRIYHSAKGYFERAADGEHLHIQQLSRYASNEAQFHSSVGLPGGREWDKLLQTLTTGY